MALNLKTYDPGIHCELAYWMAMAGQREEEIAEKFGIPLGTFHTWRNRHPELHDAMKPGRDFIDSLVKGSLLKRALGYDYGEVTRENVQVGSNADGTPKFRMKVIRRVKKHVAPDVGAQAFYLKNRCGWKDRFDVSHEVKKVFDFSNTPDEKLDEIERMILAAEVPSAGRN